MEESLGRPRRRWKGNIKIDFGEIVLKNMDWIHMVRLGSRDGLS
jgi:hypothetical protein